MFCNCTFYHTSKRQCTGQRSWLDKQMMCSNIQVYATAACRNSSYKSGLHCVPPRLLGFIPCIHSMEAKCLL
jgi:hypothetical protein